VNKKKLFFSKNLQIIFSVTMIAVMGVTSIAPVLPKISSGLHVSAKSIGWLITAFTLPGVFLSPIFGMLSDRFGRKIVLVPSLLIFGTAGTLCFFTKDFKLLLLLRFIQGTGSASIGSLNITIIGDLFKGKDRIDAMGYNSTVLSVGTAVYPAIGGALAILGWNYPFLLSLFAFPSAILVLFFIDSVETSSSMSIKNYFKETSKLLKNSNVFGYYIASLATFILLYGVLITYFPFFMKSKFGADSFLIGIVLSSAAIATAVAAFNLGHLINRFSSKKLVLFAFFAYALSIFFVKITNNFYLIFIPVLLYGMGNGINIPNVQNSIASAATVESRGMFMSINSMVLRLGQTVGPLLFGIVMSFAGINGIFYAAIIFSLLTIVILYFTIN